MAKAALKSLMLVLLLAACQQAGAATQPPAGQPTRPAATATARATSTPSPTATLKVPVELGTQVPAQESAIDAQTVTGLREVARYYGQLQYIARFSNNGEALWILDRGGITRFDYASMQPSFFYPFANFVSDLQVTTDGTRVLISNRWLLDLTNEAEPKLFDLDVEMDGVGRVALSPNGSMIASVRYLKCYTFCDYQQKIVSVADFSVLLISEGLRFRSEPTFSQDGRYFAIADYVGEEHPDGSSNLIGGSVIIWDTEGFVVVSNPKVGFPFSSSSVKFSDDNSRLLISQPRGLRVFDVQTGEELAVVPDLCESYYREADFEAGSNSRVYETSDCGASLWEIMDGSGRKVSDTYFNFTVFDFDAENNLTYVPLPMPVVTSFAPFTSLTRFAFDSEEELTFQTRQNCSLSLVRGDLECDDGVTRGEVLGRDGKLYTFADTGTVTHIYSAEAPDEPVYTLPYAGANIRVFDPINNIVVFTSGAGGAGSQITVRDMLTDVNIKSWQGNTYIEQLDFSADGALMAICRSEPYPNAFIDLDELWVYDMPNRSLVKNLKSFTCRDVRMDFSPDASQLALQYYYARDEIAGTLYSKVMLLSMLPGIDPVYLDADSVEHAIAYSADGSLVAAACGELQLCFFDPGTRDLLHSIHLRMPASYLQFSPSGNLLAILSETALLSLWGVP
jgi:WD40 repeat protein